MVLFSSVARLFWLVSRFCHYPDYTTHNYPLQPTWHKKWCFSHHFSTRHSKLISLMTMSLPLIVVALNFCAGHILLISRWSTVIPVLNSSPTCLRWITLVSSQPTHGKSITRLNQRTGASLFSAGVVPPLYSEATTNGYICITVTIRLRSFLHGSKCVKFSSALCG